RVDGKGKIIDTKYRLETSERRMASHDQDDEDASHSKSPLRRYARAPREPVQAAQQWYFGQFGGQFGVAPPAAVRQPGGRQVGGAQGGVGQFGIFGWGR